MEFFLQQAINGLILGSVFALFALGYSLVLANMRIFNVAHEGVFAWGAIAAYAAIGTLGVPLMVGLVIAMLTAGALNVLVYFTMVRQFHRRPNEELAAFIATLGGLIVLVELANVVLNRDTVRLPFDIFPIVVWHVGFVQMSSIQLMMVVTAVLSFIILWIIFEKTQLGREIKTVAYDRDTASLLGVNAQRVTIIVFALSGAMAGLSSILVATAFNVISADMGVSYGLIAIAITVIGGFGSLSGTMAAGLLVGLISSITAGYLTTSFRDVVVFGIMLLILVVKPKGLFNVAAADARV